MNKIFGKFLMVFAIEFEKLETRIKDFFKECIPGLSFELLKEWENELALPSACANPAQSLEERQQIAHAKYIENWPGQNRQVYINFADELGANISVLEFQGVGASFRVDVNRVDRGEGSGTPTERIELSRLWSLTSAYKIVITINFIYGNVSVDNIICLLRENVPAHLEVTIIDLTIGS